MAMKQFPKFVWAVIFSIMLLFVGFAVIVKMQQTMAYGKTLYTLPTSAVLAFYNMNTTGSTVGDKALDYNDNVGVDGIQPMGNSSTILLSEIDSGLISLANGTWTFSYRVIANVTNKATILCDVLLVNASTGATINTLGDDVGESALISGTSNTTVTGTFAFSNLTSLINPTQYNLKFVWYCNKTDTTKYNLKLYVGHASTKVSGLQYYRASALSYSLLVLMFTIMVIAIIIYILKYIQQKKK